MKKIVYVCDMCAVETSNPEKIIGWISWCALESFLQVRLENKNFPNLGCGSRFINLPTDLQFCSTNCLIDYITRKLK